MPGLNGAVAADEVVTLDDLEWWLALAPTLEWTEAKTYAETAPHMYVVLGRTPGLERADFVRAGRVIRTFGAPAKFYSMTGIYLTAPDGVTKWWTMDDKVTDTDLINQAVDGRVYGEQDAPSTTTRAALEHTPTLYDGLATAYDDMWIQPSDTAENTEVARLIREFFGFHAPKTLDIGAGTGLLLDLGVTAPSMFTAVDPSQGMLNELVRKHPKVARVLPISAEELSPMYVEYERFELVTATFSVASYLSAKAIFSLPQYVRPGGMLLLMTYEDGYLPDYYPPEHPGPATRHEAAAACRSLPLYRPEFKIGAFDTFVVTP